MKMEARFLRIKAQNLRVCKQLRDGKQNAAVEKSKAVALVVFLRDAVARRTTGDGVQQGAVAILQDIKTIIPHQPTLQQWLVIARLLSITRPPIILAAYVHF